MSDWLKLHRKSLDSVVFANAELWKIWSWCLMRASYKTNHVPIQTGRGETVVTLEPGQFICGRNEAARALKMKPTTFRNRLAKLKKLGNIDTQTTPHFSIITVRHWETYQNNTPEPQGKNGQPMANQRPTNGQPMATNKKVKKVKKVEKKKGAEPFLVSLESLWVTVPSHLKTSKFKKHLAQWIEWKQSSKHAWKHQNGPTMFINRLAEFTAEEAIEAIQRALESGHATVYPRSTGNKTENQRRPGFIATDPTVAAELKRSSLYDQALGPIRKQISQAATPEEKEELTQKLREARAKLEQTLAAQGVA